MFRGQIMHYEITRPIRNPYFLIEGLGETSFISSIWRNLLQNHQRSFHHFNGLNLYEWSGNDSNLLIVFYVQIMPD
ncbi:hypothetical protein PPECC9_25810, partial [Escherichia coli PCN009]